MTETCPSHDPQRVEETHFAALFGDVPIYETVWHYCQRCGERCAAPDHHTHSPRAGRKEG